MTVKSKACGPSIPILGQPFVKRFALCYGTVGCLSVLSCLSVTLVYCGQTVGRIKMTLGMRVGVSPGHTVLDVHPAPPPPKGRSRQFSAHVRCGQTAGSIKMPLGMEVRLGSDNFVLDAHPSPLPQKGAEPPPQFSAHFYCIQTVGSVSYTHLALPTIYSV